MGGELFGKTAEGEPVHRHRIEGGGLTASIMEWGAVIQDLRLAGHDAPLALGFENDTASAKNMAGGLQVQLDITDAENFIERNCFK